MTFFAGLIVGLWLGFFGCVAVVMIARRIERREARWRERVGRGAPPKGFDPNSPVGWGDKALDGTGTGLVRGGDPPSMTDTTMLGGPVPKKWKPT